MKRPVLAMAAAILFTAAVYADIARPGKTPRVTPKASGVETTMDIRLDRDATEARLIVPKAQLKQLRAELERLDDDADDTAAVAEPAGARVRLIAAGVLVSLGFVFGGMWFVRSGRAARGAGKAAVVLALLGGAGSTATLVFANIGPPLTNRSITGAMFSRDMQQAGSGWGKIRLETGAGDRVQLIVPNPRQAPSDDEE